MMARSRRTRTTNTVDAQRICSIYVLVHLVALFQAEANKLDPSNRFARAEGIFADSALIDKESGRIYWESGGSQSTLSKSVLSKFGLGPHSKATLLSLVLLLSILGHFHGWLRRKLDESVFFHRLLANRFSYLPALLLKHVCLGAPQFDNWFILGVVVLYFWEAATCKTCRYLNNPMDSPNQIEHHIEFLRQQPPTVSWNIRSFHYEPSIWYKPKLIWKLIYSALFGGTSAEYQTINKDGETNSTTMNENIGLDRYTLWPVTRKRVTHQANATYMYKHWTDSTMVGLWQRAKASTSAFTPPSMASHGAPFAKLNLSRLLVLADAKARQDYFDQQSKFIAENSVGDDLAEFSTKIEIPGFQPLLLAVRSHATTARRNLSLGAVSFQFWFFTLFGLTVPYRIWFTQHCDEIRVTVVKETFARAPLSSLSLSKNGSNGWWLWSGKGSSSADDNDPAPSTGPRQEEVDQKEIFRETMRQLALYKPKEEEDSSRLIEPVKKIIRQLAPKSSTPEQVVETADVAAAALAATSSSSNTTATDEETRSFLVQEIEDAVATAELVSANKTKSSSSGSPASSALKSMLQSSTSKSNNKRRKNSKKKAKSPGTTGYAKEQSDNEVETLMAD